MTRTKAHDEWLDHVRRWKASGPARSDYAAQAGLNPQTLGWYAWKLRYSIAKTSAPKETAVGTTTELVPGIPVVEVLPAPVALSAMEVELDGVTVRVPADFEADALSRLLMVLEARR